MVVGWLLVSVEVGVSMLMTMHILYMVWTLLSGRDARSTLKKLVLTAVVYFVSVGIVYGVVVLADAVMNVMGGLWADSLSEFLLGLGLLYVPLFIMTCALTYGHEQDDDDDKDDIDAEKLKKEIESIKAKIQALRLAYSDGSISFDEYHRETTALYNLLVMYERRLRDTERQ
jgi:hypothetical protein